MITSWTMQYKTHFLAFCVFCFVIICQSFPVGDEEKVELDLRKFGFLEFNIVLRSGDVSRPNVTVNEPKIFQRIVATNQTGRVIIDIRFKTEELGDGHPFDKPGIKVADDSSTQLAHFEIEEKKTNDERSGCKDKEPSGPPPEANDPADLCQDASLDTMIRTQNGDTYVFKGDFYWKVLDTEIAEGYPRRISDDWDGLEGNLDASLTCPNGNIYFFKGERCWRFTNKKMDIGYPKLLSSEFEGIPDTIDAAMVWSKNDKTYFFKGNQYWLYDRDSDPPVSTLYPMPIDSWTGLPKNSIDAALQWENNVTYFFKDDYYYKFNDKPFEVEKSKPSYPRSTSAWWFGCQYISHKSNKTVSSTQASFNSDDCTEQEPSGPPPGTNVAPNLCQDASIDTVTQTENGNTYVFKGYFYWKLLDNEIAEGYPRRISDDWDGLEGNLDASLTLSNGKTYFFKGERCWRFTNEEMDAGYPKLLSSEFEGIPDSIDAAFEWSGNSTIFFFKGNQYWMYDRNSYIPVSFFYPMSINIWTGLPNNIDAALQWENRRTYFFKDDIYYKFDEISFKVVESEKPPYPRPTSAWWFGC